MAKSSESVGTTLFLFIWLIGMFYLLWRVISYFVFGKKRGETMFGTRIKIKNEAQVVESPMPVNIIPNESYISNPKAKQTKAPWRKKSFAKVESDEVVMISNVTGLPMTASDVTESLNRLAAHKPLNTLPSPLKKTRSKDESKVPLIVMNEGGNTTSKDVQIDAIPVDIEVENANNIEQLQIPSLNSVESKIEGDDLHSYMVMTATNLTDLQNTTVDLKATPNIESENLSNIEEFQSPVSNDIKSNIELTNDEKDNQEDEANSHEVTMISNVSDLPMTAADVEEKLDALKAHYPPNIDTYRDGLIREMDDKAKAALLSTVTLPEVASESHNNDTKDRSDDHLATISIAFNNSSDKTAIEEDVIDLHVADEEDSDTSDDLIAFQIPRKSYHSSAESQLKWKKASEDLTLRYHKIPGGMVYVGRESSSFYYGRSEPSMIDLDFPVDPDPKALHEEIGYYPNYQSLSLKQKGAYLYWLSHGRKDPSVNIGYVFIYFYGLERRALLDLDDGKDKEESFVIYNEVKRLLSIYKTSDSFSRYAGGFLGLLNVMYDFEPVELTTLPKGYYFEVPLPIKIELGKHVFQKKPLPASLVMLWFDHTQFYSKRTPFDRCRSEFTLLFQKRYQEKYGEGIEVSKIPKRNLDIHYQYANNSLRSPFYYSLENIPDVAAMTQVFNKVTALAEKCMDELDAYSRYLGRNEEKRDTIFVYSLLPDELVKDLKSPILISLSNWIDAQFTSTTLVHTLKEDIIRQLELKDSQKLSSKDWLSIVHLFKKLGVGIETDPRFGSVKFEKVKHLVLFKLSLKSESTASTHYSFIQLFLHLASYFGGTSIEEKNAEKLHLTGWLKGQKELTTSEKDRLIAHLEWLYIEQPEINTTKKRIQSLTEEQKTTFVTELMILAGIDGQIEAEEVKMLQKVYEWINRDESQLFSDLHSLQSDGEISPKQSRGQGGKTKESTENSHAVVLDTKKIKKRLAETKEVNAILSTVFMDVDEQPQAKRATKKAQSKIIGNLDEVHSLLILELVRKNRWTRDEFEAICQDKGLFVDGALEMINEAAFAIADEALIEDDDPLTINVEVAKKMKAI